MARTARPIQSRPADMCHAVGAGYQQEL